MWALRRAANPVRSSSHRVLTARACITKLEVTEGHYGNYSTNPNTSQIPNSNSNSNSNSFGCFSSPSSFLWSRNLSSHAGANSSDKEENGMEGFSDLDESMEEREIENRENGEDEVSDGLSESEEESKEERVYRRRNYQSPIFRILMETKRETMAGALEKWLAENGNELERAEVYNTMLHLRRRKLYIKALQFMEWLEESKHFEYMEMDYSSRVDLVAKVHGLYRAEKHIEQIPQSMRTEPVYRSLLSNHVAALNVTKSESIFNKMRNLGFPLTSFTCNQLLLLYKRVDKKKIADVLLMMDQENVKPTIFTYKLLIDSKGTTKDIEGMEQIIETMKSEGFEPDLPISAIIAKHYISAGQNEKAELVVKGMERENIKENRAACKLVLPLYASLGNADDVARVWEICKNDPRSEELLAAIESFGQLGEIDEAEKIFEQASRMFNRLDTKFYNTLLKIYAERQLLTKGKELTKRMSDGGVRVMAPTMDAIVRLYVEAGEVEKADSIFNKYLQQNQPKPMYCTFLTLLGSYAKRGDYHNAERIFHRLRQFGYYGRIRQYQLLLQAYINAKTPAYGFRERMKADNIFPTKAVAAQLVAADAFRKSAVSDLLN